MSNAQSFPFLSVHQAGGRQVFMPYLPLDLAAGDHKVSVSGLLDTGATISVLPFKMGVALGMDWDSQAIPLQLAGNLAAVEARALFLDAQVGTFPPVKLAFAWVRSDAVPLLLGHVNFFDEFDVCF